MGKHISSDSTQQIGSVAWQVAIQGERGSNSHVAAMQAPLPGEPGAWVLRPSASAEDLFAWLCAEAAGARRIAVLPIENSLHGAVFEHLDLLLDQPVGIVAETLLRIRHNVIAAPGVTLEQLRQVRSHPVALSQCRRWLAAHPALEAVPAYDTAGAVKQLMAAGQRDVAAIAPELAAAEYGAEVLLRGIEDHRENYTRFLVLMPRAEAAGLPRMGEPDKISVAFTLDHRPGTLLTALEVFRDGGLNLTKIESRPVPGRPWEYVFFVDARFDREAAVDEALARMGACTHRLEVLGRYRAAELGELR